MRYYRNRNKGSRIGYALVIAAIAVYLISKWGDKHSPVISTIAVTMLIICTLIAASILTAIVITVRRTIRVMVYRPEIPAVSRPEIPVITDAKILHGTVISPVKALENSSEFDKNAII